MNAPLEVQSLSISFLVDGRLSRPVRDVTFSVRPGARVALVGESGCGKSLTALALAGLPPVDRATVGGTIADLPRLAYVFQNPTESFNPVMRVGAQIDEALKQNAACGRSSRRARAVALLARTGLAEPERVYGSHPCELSGGQLQRAMIAMALAAGPELLVCDEPTTALDVTTQKQVMELIDSLARENGMAVLFITHNLGLVAGAMDFVNVMYAGIVVESGPVEEVLTSPRHPYTRGLLAAVPILDAPRDAPLADLPGTVPPPTDWPEGCAFAPRCPHATERCRREDPAEHVQGERRWRCWQTT